MFPLVAPFSQRQSDSAPRLLSAFSCRIARFDGATHSATVVKCFPVRRRGPRAIAVSNNGKFFNYVRERGDKVFSNDIFLTSDEAAIFIFRRVVVGCIIKCGHSFSPGAVTSQLFHAKSIPIYLFMQLLIAY